MISLRGKNALVTGGSRGIGAATAVLLADAGANVGIGYRSREADAAAVVRDIASRGVKAFAHAADLSRADATQSLFETARRELGGLDIFVGNAGIWPAQDTAVGEMSDERWLETMRQNIDSIFYGSRLAARMLGNGGRIVLVSSTAGQRGEAFHADYAATKGAIISVREVARDRARAARHHGELGRARVGRHRHVGAGLRKRRAGAHCAVDSDRPHRDGDGHRRADRVPVLRSRAPHHRRDL